MTVAVPHGHPYSRSPELFFITFISFITNEKKRVANVSEIREAESSSAPTKTRTLKTMLHTIKHNYSLPSSTLLLFGTFKNSS